MTNLLPPLHDPHDRGLRLEIPVRGHALVRLLVLGFGLLGLDLVDFDAVFGVREGFVDAEGVGWEDIFRLGRFG